MVVKTDLGRQPSCCRAPGRAIWAVFPAGGKQPVRSVSTGFNGQDRVERQARPMAQRESTPPKAMGMAPLRRLRGAKPHFVATRPGARVRRRGARLRSGLRGWRLAAGGPATGCRRGKKRDLGRRLDAARESIDLPSLDTQSSRCPGGKPESENAPITKRFRRAQRYRVEHAGPAYCISNQTVAVRVIAMYGACC